MFSAPVNINDANQMVRHRVTISDGQLKLPNSSAGWAWVTLIVALPGQGLSIASDPNPEQIHHVEIPGSRTQIWIFEAQNSPVFINGISEGTGLECYFGDLPAPLADLMSKNAAAAARLVAELLGVLCLDQPLDTVPDNIAQHPEGFDLMRGGAAVARRLGLFRSEVILLEQALNIRASANVMRLLSYAHANAQNYPSAIEAAQSALTAKPELARGAFQDHLDELHAFSVLADEMQALAQSRLRHRAVGGKVAYCLHSARPFGHGGYAMRSHGLSKAVLDHGRDVTMFARPGFPSDGSDPGATPQGEHVVDGVSYFFENQFGRRGRAYGYIRDAADYFEKSFSAHDIGIVHAATNFWTALPAGIAAFRLGLPFVYEIRSFWTITREARIENFAQSPQGIRDEGLESIALSMADEVITLNTQMRDKLIAMAVPAEQITIVPNSVDPATYRPGSSDQEMSARFQLEQDDIVVGYMGAMLDYEGIDLLVEAVGPIIASNPRIKVLLVGANSTLRADPSSVEHRLAKQIEHHDLGENIQLVDRVSAETARDLYQLFDICVYPRRALEVCELVSPLKPLEAMAAGKTVVGSDVGGLSGMLRHEQTGLVFAKENVSALQAALRRVIENPELREQLANGAQDFVRSERRWDLAAAQVDELYQRVEQSRSFQPTQLLENIASHFDERDDRK